MAEFKYDSKGACFLDDRTDDMTGIEVFFAFVIMRGLYKIIFDNNRRWN